MPGKQNLISCRAWPYGVFVNVVDLFSRKIIKSETEIKHAMFAKVNQEVKNCIADWRGSVLFLQDGYTALTHAAKEGYVDITVLLLQKGTYVNPPDRVSRNYGDRVFSFFSSSSGSSFKTRVLAYHNAYCSWLFQGRLSFGTPPPPPTHTRRLKGAMHISVIGHPLEVPLQALQGYS